MQVAEEKPLAKNYDTTLVRWVWQYIRPYQGLFWLATILMPLDTAFLLAQPYVIKLTVDEFLSGAHGAPAPAWLAMLLHAAGGHGLFVMGGLYLALVICEFGAFYAQFYLMMMVAQFSLSDLRMALFRKVERLPMSFFDRTPVGRLVSRMTTDIDSINDMFSAGSLTIFIDAMTLLGIITIMISLSPRLALSALCAIPPLTAVIYFLSSRSRIVYGQIRDRLAALNSYLSEALAGMVIVQLFTRERESRREFDVLNLRSRDVQMMAANVYEAAQFSSVEALSSITVAVILWIGGGSVIRHLVTLGTLIAFIQYAQQFFMPLRDISTKYSALQSALAAVEKIHALMEGEKILALAEHPQSPAISRGSIVFDHVNFEYRPGEPILKDLSFTVAAGQKIAIGATGSRQDHHHQAAESLVRRHQRTNLGRRRRRARVGPRRAAARDWIRAAGRVSVRRRRDGKYPAVANRGAKRKCAMRCAARRRCVSSSDCRAHWRRKFASAVRTCRRASGNYCRSRARWRTTRESS